MNKLMSLAFAVLLIAMPSQAQAQDPVAGAAAAADDLLETVATEEDENAEPRWDTSIGFGGSLTTGNSDTLGLNLAVDSEKLTERNEYRLGIMGSYGETDGLTSTELANLYFNYKRMFGSSYIYSDNSLFHDKIAMIAYRFTAGVGYGRYVIDNDRTRLGLEGGVAYIHTDYEDDPAGVWVTPDAEDTFALRLAQTFEYKLSETSKIWQTIEYLPDFSDFDNYLLNGTIGIEAALNSTLSLRLGLENRYNSRPPYDTKRNDLITVAALAVRF